MSSPEHLPPQVRELTPTAKVVYLVLDRVDEGLTVASIVEETGQSRRAVVRALTALNGDGIVTGCPDPADPRRDVWTLIE